MLELICVTTTVYDTNIHDKKDFGKKTKQNKQHKNEERLILLPFKIIDFNFLTFKEENNNQGSN